VNPAKLIAVLAADACRCLREPADRFGHQTQHGRQVSLAVVTSDVSVGSLQSVKSQNLKALFSEVNEPL
jgi:hypothetical protein